MWPFKLRLSDEGVENAIAYSRTKFYVFPTLETASPQFMKTAYRLATDEWTYKGEKLRGGPEWIHESNKVHFWLEKDAPDSEAWQEHENLENINPRDTSLRTYLAYGALREDPFAGLDEESKNEIIKNQQHLLEKIEDVLFTSKSGKDLSDMLRSALSATNFGQTWDIQARGADFHSVNALRPLNQHWMAAGKEWQTNFIGKWLLYHPRMEKSPLAQEWEPLMLFRTMNEVLKSEKIGSLGQLWEKVYHHTELKKTPGAISRALSPLISNDDWKRLSDVFDLNADPSQKAKKIKMEDADPNKIREADDARVEFLRETQGAAGSASSFAGNPYADNPRNARPHGFRQKKFTPK